MPHVGTIIIVETILNLNKFIFYMSFGTLLGHVVYKYGVLLDPPKIATIINLEASTNVHIMQSTLGHKGYYIRFIKGYVLTTTPMEQLLKNKDFA